MKKGDWFKNIANLKLYMGNYYVYKRVGEDTYHAIIERNPPITVLNIGHEGYANFVLMFLRHLYETRDKIQLHNGYPNSDLPKGLKTEPLETKKFDVMVGISEQHNKILDLEGKLREERL